jgi:hypothetical protein
MPTSKHGGKGYYYFSFQEEEITTCQFLDLKSQRESFLKIVNPRLSENVIRIISHQSRLVLKTSRLGSNSHTRSGSIIGWIWLAKKAIHEHEKASVGGEATLAQEVVYWLESLIPSSPALRTDCK